MKAEAKMNLNRKEIEQHLHSAVTGLTPDLLDRIDLSVPQDAGKQNVSNRSGFRIFKRTAAAAACVCLLSVTGGIYAYGETRVVSVVGIDVNPGIELSLNRNDRILKAEAVNEDAAGILESVDVKGKKLDKAVARIVDSMLDHGYLKEAVNGVLVTVSEVNPGKQAVSEQAVAQKVKDALEAKEVQAVVYDQKIEVTPELKEMAQEYGISCGKAYFVQTLAEEEESLDPDRMEELASLNITQLSQEIVENDGILSEDELQDEIQDEDAFDEDDETDGTGENADGIGEDSREGQEDKASEVETISSEDGEPEAENEAEEPESQEISSEEPETEPQEAKTDDREATPSDGTRISTPSDAAATPSDASEEAGDDEDMADEEEEETEDESVELEWDIDGTPGLDGSDSASI